MKFYITFVLYPMIRNLCRIFLCTNDIKFTKNKCDNFSANIIGILFECCLFLYGTLKIGNLHFNPIQGIGVYICTPLSRFDWNEDLLRRRRFEFFYFQFHPIRHILWKFGVSITSTSNFIAFSEEDLYVL